MEGEGREWREGRERRGTGTLKIGNKMKVFSVVLEEFKENLQ